jgi:hypothetical protein
MNKFFFSMLLFSVFAIGSLQAQGDRAPSPSATFVQKVGLTDITIEYSRPGMKDRSIFAADGLVPFGKVWRTGANSATKITFSDAVKIGDGELAAGSYAILTKPGASSWDVHFYPYEGTRWNSYTEATPSIVVKATSVQLNQTVESFLISIDNLRDYSASLVFAWDKTVASLPITVK